MQFNAKPNIVVVGLGYVGLPLAIAFSRHFPTIGFDIDSERIGELRDGADRTNEIDRATLSSSTLLLTDAPADAIGADVYVITVPTPVDGNNKPDLRPVISATKCVAKMIDPARPTVIVYESTVYPGVTEEICGPLLEEESGLKRGANFWLGYSPERINPGDREHTVDRIIKVVSGESPDVLDHLAFLYGKITSAGTFKAASIKAAEAAKVIENAQRDINIAFMNEVSTIFSKIGLSIWDVLDAANTKWNFLPFQPGLVGGHCIGVDPYYLSHLAQEIGHEPEVILSGRRINDGMGDWIAEEIDQRISRKSGRVLVLGITFKENVPDIRNSKVVDVVAGLKQRGHDVIVHDPRADPVEAQREYGLVIDHGALENTGYDAVIGAVPHDEYKALGTKELSCLLADDGLLADLKGMWRANSCPSMRRWSL